MIDRANLRPNSWSQSGSRSRRGLGSRATQIMHEYDLETKIMILPIIHAHTCGMSSSNFAAIVRIKFVSMTRAYLPSMKSTEITNGGTFFVYRVITRCAYPFLFSPTDPGASLFDQTYRYKFQHPQIRRQLWH